MRRIRITHGVCLWGIKLVMVVVGSREKGAHKALGYFTAFLLGVTSGDHLLPVPYQIKVVTLR